MLGNLLRLATAGSVDDGKSTLIGRLLFDAKAIFDDHFAAVEETSAQRGLTGTDLALLTDGLRDERAQGITIDVAYRYFATPKRKFIIADTPGHIQYTRNMVTGASTADVALILVDAEKGLLEQSRRHAFLASLLGVPHIIVCVNKMDLVGYSQERFEEIREEFRRFAMKLDIHDLTFVPVSALLGDNVVTSSVQMPWYEGGALLHQLEEVHVASDRNLIDARFPVQYIIRAHGSDVKDGQGAQGFRGYSGTIAGGIFKPGDEVTVLPCGFSTTVKAIWGPGGTEIDEAFTGQAVTIELEHEIDIVRGDMLCRPANRPHVGSDLDAMVCWMADDVELKPDGRYILQHTTRSVHSTVSALDYRLNVNTLHRDADATSLAMNEIGRIRLRTQKPLLFDPYRRNRDTGSFVLVDDVTNNTVAAGMITGPAVTAPAAAVPNVVWHTPTCDRDQRATQGMTVWLTGLSASGKSTVGAELERRLVTAARPAYLIDGDNLRHGINAGLGFTTQDRKECVRRAGEVAKLFADAGMISVVSLISPYREDRDHVRKIHKDAGLRFVEVFVDTPLEICAQRDPKGFYAKAIAGEITGFTGVDDPYEAPRSPDVILRPDDGDPAAQVDILLDWLGVCGR